MNSGAFAPTFGRSPFVWMGFPFSVTWAMVAPPSLVVCWSRARSNPEAARALQGTGVEDLDLVLPAGVVEDEAVIARAHPEHGRHLPRLIL